MPEALLESIADMTMRDLRDHALIATLIYSFTRSGAALNMKVEDLQPRGVGRTSRPGRATTIHVYIAALDEVRAGTIDVPIVGKARAGGCGRILSANVARNRHDATVGRNQRGEAT